MDVFSELQPIIQDVFDYKETPLSDDFDVSSLPEWDSLTQIRFVIALEKHFHIKFSLSELSQLKRIKLIADIVEQKIM